MRESNLHQQIFIWHWNHRPKERGRLFMVHNNPKDRRQGALLKSMGLVAGVSDLIYLLPKGRCIFLELKTEKGYQSKVQKDWQKVVENLGHRYCIVRSLEDFQKIISESNTD